VAANLPYYITNAVLRHLLEAAHPPARATLMVQAEVAERVCAAPGAMSLLSAAVQCYAEPSIAFRVPAGAFYPRPNVDSAVLQLRTRRHPAVQDLDADRFFAVVRAGFGQKRKQLRNSLSAGLARSKTEIGAALTAAGIAPDRRAQTLSIAEWAALTHALDS
jgi:16S rRNA (adenine1518-N6/adenine1519-N6)-dimethyltransferase